VKRSQSAHGALESKRALPEPRVLMCLSDCSVPGASISKLDLGKATQDIASLPFTENLAKTLDPGLFRVDE